MKKVLFLVFWCSVCLSEENNPVSAAISSDVTPILKAETTASIPESEKKKDFIKSAEFAGDFRYRHQSIKQGLNQSRPVNRIMFRAGHVISLQEDLKMTYRLMTGTSNNSGNNTLGDSKSPGAPRQSIGLDQAFATYTPVKQLSLFIGKQPQFFTTAGKNQVLLDRDIALEGVGAQSKFKVFDEKVDFGINAGTFWIREKYDDTFGEDLTDSFLNTAQVLLSTKKNDFKFTIGYGIFSYTSVKDDKPTSFLVGATNSKGNTLDLLGNYQWQYELIQNQIEIKWNHKDLEIALFAETLENTSADLANRAMITGASVGWKQFSATMLNQKIESDAVMAMYTDSDFSDGQTNSEGTILSLSYKFNKNASLSYSEYVNKQSVDILSTDYRRSHMDLSISF